MEVRRALAATMEPLETTMAGEAARVFFACKENFMSTISLRGDIDLPMWFPRRRPTIHGKRTRRKTVGGGHENPMKLSIAVPRQQAMIHRQWPLEEVQKEIEHIATTLIHAEDILRAGNLLPTDPGRLKKFDDLSKHYAQHASTYLSKQTYLHATDGFELWRTFLLFELPTWLHVNMSDVDLLSYSFRTQMSRDDWVQPVVVLLRYSEFSLQTFLRHCLADFLDSSLPDERKMLYNIVVVPLVDQEMYPHYGSAQQPVQSSYQMYIHDIVHTDAMQNYRKLRPLLLSMDSDLMAPRRLIYQYLSNQRNIHSLSPSSLNLLQYIIFIMLHEQCLNPLKNRSPFLSVTAFTIADNCEFFAEKIFFESIMYPFCPKEWRNHIYDADWKTNESVQDILTTHPLFFDDFHQTLHTWRRVNTPSALAQFLNNSIDFVVTQVVDHCGTIPSNATTVEDRIQSITPFHPLVKMRVFFDKLQKLFPRNPSTMASPAQDDIPSPRVSLNNNVEFGKVVADDVHRTLRFYMNPHQPIDLVFLQLTKYINPQLYDLYEFDLRNAADYINHYDYQEITESWFDTIAQYYYLKRKKNKSLDRFVIRGYLPESYTFLQFYQTHSIPYDLQLIIDNHTNPVIIESLRRKLTKDDLQEMIDTASEHFPPSNKKPRLS